MLTDAYPHRMYCSECFCTAVPNVEFLKQWGMEYEFCPHIGAPMKEVEKWMTYQELIDALRKMKVQTNSFACLGCGHEHNCGICGCAIIREAEKSLEEMKND